MADVFGGLTLPAPAPLQGEAVTDPLLGHLGAFLRASLTADLKVAWAAVAPREPMVRRVLLHNPEKCDVTDKDFPSLYVWRSKTTPVSLSDDVVSDEASIRVLWPFAPTNALTLSSQLPIFNGIVKSVRRSLLLGRHPAWIVAGDTDPQAPTRGSLLWKYTGIANVRIEKADPDEDIVVERLSNVGKLNAYPAIIIDIEVTETLSLDPLQPGVVPTALTADVDHINSEDSDLRVAAVQDPPVGV